MGQTFAQVVAEMGPPPAQMRRGEALGIMAACHVRKASYTTRGDARRVVRHSGERGLRAYPCPFASVLGIDAHWHVGHVPSSQVVERMALAIRYLAEHPELTVRLRGPSRA